MFLLLKLPNLLFSVKWFL